MEDEKSILNVRAAGGACFGGGEKEKERKSRIEGHGIAAGIGGGGRERANTRACKRQRAHAREGAHQAQLVIELLDTVPMGLFGLILRALGVQFLHLWKFLIKLSLSLSLSLSLCNFPITLHGKTKTV